ncbi:Isochorismatase hydrolase [Lindgomyces ingoldianus]|uniref:Isochorismatase hydrolase n=1 Tax=Lindgomyces ingoldianus TaxID=673940 RepID=A0ACB6QZ94_9PLEO|nr:Isochorismatase hydrolase [Lindgomyces ingoldianus]KAF2472318.1 Isochorismatase hydrolase [Lindgomyces ingoldianus]
MAASTKTALLIIDMQNCFLPMTTTALPNILKLSKFFTQQNLPQILTQHGHPPADFTPPITNQVVRKWGVDGSIHSSTPKWELIPAIADLVTGDTPVIAKNTYDSFINTGLEKELKKRAVGRVVITGVMTDCCCDTTGRGAFNRGFETWMVSDATGSKEKEQHERGLKAWAFGYGDVITTEEVIERLS